MILEDNTYEELRYDLSKEPMVVYDDHETAGFVSDILTKRSLKIIQPKYTTEDIQNTLRELFRRNDIWHLYTDDTYENRRKSANEYIGRPEIRESVFALHGKKCLSCGSNNKIHLDHIVPVVYGGENSIDNLQPLCDKCNTSKGIKTIDYRP